VGEACACRLLLVIGSCMGKGSARGVDAVSEVAGLEMDGSRVVWHLGLLMTVSVV
jgi:hypothetical protein